MSSTTHSDRRGIVVIGGGGHGRVVIDALRAAGRDVLGVVDINPAVTGSVPFLGTEQALDRYPPAEVDLANGLGSVGPVDNRRAAFKRLKAKGYRFAAVRHPSAIVAPDVSLGEGTQALAGVVLQTGCRIGDNVIINTRASVDHDCQIGEHSHIAPGVVLSGAVRVGAGCHIGTGAVIIQNVNVGAGAVIGAGTLVLRDVAAGVRIVAPRLVEQS